MSKNILLSFTHEQARRGAYARSDRGLKTIETARLVGSVGRADQLDRSFRYRGWFGAPRGTDSRLMRLRSLFDTGRVPPIEVYRIGDDLFVVDGHHRARLALARGQDFLDAHVIEYLPDRSDPANAVYYERNAFVAATGLDRVQAVEAGRYPRLLNRVRDHHHELRRSARRGTPPNPEQLVLGVLLAGSEARLDLRQSARDWYEREYVPVTEVLTAEDILARFPGRAIGDVYGYVCDHRWYLSERRGDVGIEDALADFVHRHRPEPLTEALLDPIASLGAEVLEAAPVRGLGWLRGWAAHTGAAFAFGLLALPLAFARGLRPADYRIPRSQEG